MPTIDTLADRLVPIESGTPARDVLARFVRESGVMGLPVVENGRPVGLVERNDLLIRIAGPQAYAEYADQPISRLMDTEPAVVEAGLEIDMVCDPILNSSPDALTRSFIVTRGGAYWGVGTALALVRAAHEQQRQTGSVARPASVDDSQHTLAAARAKSAFLTVLSRELRTPLNGVLAVADLLSRQPLNSDAKAHVLTILDSSEAMLQILEDAVDLSRAEAGELDITSQPTPLRAIMDDIQASWTPRAQRDGVTLMVGYEGDTELSADIDGARLRQVFDNLVGNALKFARNGVVEASLSAQASRGSIHIQARVRDNGPGLGAELSERAFDPFAQDASDATGMGLTICREIIERMGGQISVENNQGHGATFAFSLSAPEARPDPETETNVAALEGMDLDASPHVLIVDDNATNRVVAQALCEMFGCTCEAAEDGQEAYEAVQARGYDLILMDIKMPRMDGVAATAAIRDLGGQAAQIPIIALTANADPDDARRYLAAGMAAVVEKPIKPERLRLAMNTALAGRETETEAGAGGARRSA